MRAPQGRSLLRSRRLLRLTATSLHVHRLRHIGPGCDLRIRVGYRRRGVPGGGRQRDRKHYDGLPDAAWSLFGPPSWVTNATSGTGNGTLTYLVTANRGSGPLRHHDHRRRPLRSGARVRLLSPGLNLIGSMPHLAALENWTTAFTMVNKGASSATARLSLFGDAVDPTGNGPLMLPLAFPQQAARLPNNPPCRDRCWPPPSTGRWPRMLP